VEATLDLEKSQHQTNRPYLTDRLVFYPSSNSITDYNSSNNLDYLGQQNQVRFIKESGYIPIVSPPPIHLEYNAKNYSEAHVPILFSLTNSSQSQHGFESASSVNSADPSIHAKKHEQFISRHSSAKPPKVWNN